MHLFLEIFPLYSWKCH